MSSRGSGDHGSERLPPAAEEFPGGQQLLGFPGVRPAALQVVVAVVITVAVGTRMPDAPECQAGALGVGDGPLRAVTLLARRDAGDPNRLFLGCPPFAEVRRPGPGMATPARHPAMGDVAEPRVRE